MTFAQALEALEARQETRIELGLARVRRHLARLGRPDRRVPAFHVAGTNGKGSTCAVLDAVLRASGRRVGLYTSPHLRDVRERIRVDGRPIPRPDFARLMTRALGADPTGRLTYFELLTSVAFQHFAERRCDVAVLETGLGGRLDATNVVEEPLAAVITSVDHDHQAFLGRSLGAIAAQKAGILKPGRPAVVAALPPAAMAAVRRAHPAPRVVRRPWAAAGADWRRGVQLLRAPSGRTFRLSLLGRRQRRNVALAAAAVKVSGLDVPVAAWRRGLASVRWPARFQPLRLGSRTLIVDGGHNPEAARALAETWADSPWSRRPARWILGLLRDKDASGILAPLSAHLREVVAVAPPSPRALDPLELAAAVRRAAPGARVTVERDAACAVAAWRRERGAAAVAVCAGSLYLAGAALAAAGRRP
ncbi:MAG: bifunctional folylpolyglutamate synthase/dihydrofolate synthase [Elusimicrobia bacterium]|nr:bifunctional folylpolyglutamate synthase/dihydrofolate synthase [Elusimicrobiota bacterium]